MKMLIDYISVYGGGLCVLLFYVMRVCVKHILPSELDAYICQLNYLLTYCHFLFGFYTRGSNLTLRKIAVFGSGLRSYG